MATILRLLIPCTLLLALLSACDPRNEEETSIAPSEGLSATDIIQRILEAEKSITSIREDRTDISSQLAVPLGDVDTTPQESRELRIQVGNDSYSKDEFVEPDFCEGDPACLESLSPPDETLSYNGSIYYRDRSGDRWVLEPEAGCPADDPSVACFDVLLEEVGTGGFIECPALGSIEPTQFSEVYSFDFSWLTNPQRIEAGVEGAGLIQIRGTIDEPFWSLGLSPDMEAAYAECGIDPTDLFGGSDVPAYIRDYMPDRFEGSADIWLDPVTFYVNRVEWRLDSFNEDRLLQTDTTCARYSLFNEAALPGPLPE